MTSMELYSMCASPLAGRCVNEVLAQPLCSEAYANHMAGLRTPALVIGRRFTHPALIGRRCYN